MVQYANHITEKARFPNATQCYRGMPTNQPYNIQGLEVLRVDLIHPDALPPKSLLTTLVTLALAMTESTLGSLASLSSVEGARWFASIFSRLTDSHSPCLPPTPPRLEFLPPGHSGACWRATTRHLFGEFHRPTWANKTTSSA